jgi:hypothetical protein
MFACSVSAHRTIAGGSRTSDFCVLRRRPKIRDQVPDVSVTVTLEKPEILPHRRSADAPVGRRREISGRLEKPVAKPIRQNA